MNRLTCSNCGGEIEYIRILTDPPIHKYICKKCKTTKEDRDFTSELIIEMGLTNE